MLKNNEICRGSLTVQRIFTPVGNCRKEIRRIFDRNTGKEVGTMDKVFTVPNGKRVGPVKITRY